MIGLYSPGQSIVHRMAPGPKLLVLVAVSVVVVQIQTLGWIGCAALVTIGLFALARIPYGVSISRLGPALWFLIPIFGLQWFLTGIVPAAVLIGQLLVVLALASLVTLTTKVADMLATFERILGPLQRFGLDPGRIALVLALTIRCIPLVGTSYAEAREAQRARGLDRSPVALVVPLVIRLLRKADRMGEALAARGIDD